MTKTELAWNLIEQLRGKIVSNQKNRAQIIGFKITAITAGVGFVLANIDKIPPLVLIILAYASVSFDFLIESYSYSIRRAGYYIRTRLEIVLRESTKWPSDVELWEEFMAAKHANFSRKKSRKLSFWGWGNLGLTFLVSGIAFASPFISSENSSENVAILITASVFLILLAYLLVKDVQAFISPTKFDQAKKVEAIVESKELP